MRSWFLRLACAFILAGVALYVAAPFHAAWTIRQAVKSGDIDTLRERVVWQEVRRTLRASIVEHAQLLPAAVKEGRRVRPTLWQRIKSVFGETMLDRFMDQYITPEGLPQLYRIKHTRRGQRQRQAGTELASTSWPLDKPTLSFLRRVKRAQFLSLTEVEIELEDQEQPERRIVGTLSLVRTQWKLTALRVISSPDDKAGVDGTASSEELRLYQDDVRSGRIRPSNTGA